MDGLTTSEYQTLILSVGTHLNDRILSPVEVADLLAKSMAAGNSRKDCSEALGLGMSQLGTFLNLNKLDPEVKHLAGWRGTTDATIAFSTLSQLVDLSPDDQLGVAQAILRHRITRKETEQVIQIHRRSGKQIADCVTDVLRLRPQVETRHVLFGAITSEEEKQYFSALAQKDRDKLMKQALILVLPDGYSVDSHLSSGSFTIVSNHDLTSLLGVAADQFEEIVNSKLAELRERS